MSDYSKYIISVTTGQTLEVVLSLGNDEPQQYKEWSPVCPRRGSVTVTDMKGADSIRLTRYTEVLSPLVITPHTSHLINTLCVPVPCPYIRSGLPGT